MIYWLIQWNLTEKANSPEALYIPQLNISESTSLMTSCFRTSSPLIGQVPPLARVAPMTASASQFNSKEQVCQFKLYCKYCMVTHLCKCKHHNCLLPGSTCPVQHWHHILVESSCFPSCGKWEQSSCGHGLSQTWRSDCWSQHALRQQCATNECVRIIVWIWWCLLWRC